MEYIQHEVPLPAEQTLWPPDDASEHDKEIFYETEIQ